MQQTSVVADLGQSEVCKLNVPRVGEQHIIRLQVSVSQ